MDTIASFEMDHEKLIPGIYVSRRDYDIVTYDLRVVRPNCGEYPSNAVLHTIEHLFAVKTRNGKYGQNIIYFGPMGCRTGFYLLIKGMTHDEVVMLVQDTVKYISAYKGVIPGVSAKECGNYLEHDQEGAIQTCLRYCESIKNLTGKDVYY